MTRLTIAATGDPLTFRPVTSSVSRVTKDGIVDVVILLFGTHYNISMNGILQQDSNDQIDDNTKSLAVNAGSIELKLEQKSGGVSAAELSGSFSSFMYFYPGLRIKGHLKLSETTHAPTVPEFEAHYHFKDLLNLDELRFKLTLFENNLEFDVTEVVGGVETVIYNEVLSGGVDHKHFEFDFLGINGKSRLFIFTNYGTLTQTKTRVWIGNLNAKLGECNVSLHGHSDEQVLKTVSSDFIFLEYPSIFLKYDREPTDKFIGEIKVYDAMNTLVEADWKQIRSRDYKFTGNRVFENGMIRIVLNTNTPDLEVWGWSFNLTTPIWEKVLTLKTPADTGSSSLKIQNIVFEYMSRMQLKVVVNFGTSIYEFIMTKGDPYITVLNKDKLKLKIVSGKNSMGADFADTDNGYSLTNTFEGGHVDVIKATGTVTCASVLANDTYTLNGLVYTAVAGSKGGDNTKFSIDTSDTACAADLADSIANDTRIGVIEIGHTFVAVSVSAIVTITDNIGGIGGNNVTTVSSNGGRLAVDNTTLTSGAATGGPTTQTLTGYTMKDNYFGFYNNDSGSEVVGWLSHMIKPDSVQIDLIAGNLEYEFVYPVVGNIFGLGILASFPTNLVGKVPFPFAVGTQDEYIKWRANEAILAFRETESFKKR